MRPWTTTEGENLMRKVPYPHSGEILLEEFLPMGITQYRLAKEIGVRQRRIGEIAVRTPSPPIRACVCHGSSACRQLGLDPRKMEVPGHKRLEIDFGHPIQEIIA